MTTLAATIARAVNFNSKRWPGVTSEDIEQEAWVSILEAPNNVSADTVGGLVQRIANREYKQMQRRRTVTFSALGKGDFNAFNPIDEGTQGIEQLIFADSAQKAALSEFDRETVLVLSGQHREFESFHQLA